MSAPRVARAAVLLVALVVAGLGVGRAVSPGPPPSVQEQADSLSATIRCPTCQGLSIKDSPSVLATGSRQVVEEQLAQGRSPEQVRQYFVDRYGPSALLSPAGDGPGLLVWTAPALVLPLAGVLGWRRLRRRGVGAPRTPGPAGALGTEDDADAATALHAYRAGTLDPDASPAGEALREALTVRLAADLDVLDADDLDRADLRLAAAFRRYQSRARTAPARSSSVRRGRPGPALPRRALVAATAATVLVGAGAALAAGTRDRGADDLPTGDLPGSVATPGLGQLQQATAERPDDAQAWIALGRAHEAAGTLTAAVAAYDRALALTPAADDVKLLRAGLLLRGGSVREALPVLTDLARRHPGDADTVLLLGLAQQRLERPEAGGTLRRYLELAPQGPGAETVRRLLAAG